MNVVLIPLLQLILTILHLYQWCVILMVIMNLFQVLNIINAYSRLVMGINSFLMQIIEPLLKPLRKVLPHFTVIDLSPLALILLLGFMENVFKQIILKKWVGL